jgi:putative DNA primase/helicase
MSETEPEGFSDYRTQHPEFFPDDQPIEKQHAYYQVMRQQQRQRDDEHKEARRKGFAALDRAVEVKHSPMDPVPTPEPTAIGEDYTDVGNGRRLARNFSDKLRYCNPQRRWYIWDNTRWAPDNTRMIERYAKLTVEGIAREVSYTMDPDGWAACVKWAGKSADMRRVESMIRSCMSEHGFFIPIKPDQLDCDPSRFNVLNGTLDLTTLELKPHDPEDLITRLSPVVYDQSAKCPQWENFIDRIFRGQPEKDEILAFLRRVAGYTLLGDNPDEKMFFPHGPGANGKSTFIDVLRALLGDYAVSVESATFCTVRQGATRNDIARLAGARMACACESAIDAVIDEQVLKSLTGKDTISARFLYQEQFEFRPGCKIWWSFNHLPRIRDTSNAMWRRIFTIPFMETIPESERDPHLSEKLKGELPGILNWAILGLIDYRANGFKPPFTVAKYTEQAREDQDLLADFIGSCFVTSRDQSLSDANERLCIESRDLNRIYQDYCEGQRIQKNDRMSPIRLGRELAQRGYRTHRTNGKTLYLDIAAKAGGMERRV